MKFFRRGSYVRQRIAHDFGETYSLKRFGIRGTMTWCPAVLDKCTDAHLRAFPIGNLRHAISVYLPRKQPRAAAFHSINLAAPRRIDCQLMLFIINVLIQYIKAMSTLRSSCVGRIVRSCPKALAAQSHPPWILHGIGAGASTSLEHHTGDSAPASVDPHPPGLRLHCHSLRRNQATHMRFIAPPEPHVSRGLHAAAESVALRVDPRVPPAGFNPSRNFDPNRQSI